MGDGERREAARRQYFSIQSLQRRVISRDDDAVVSDGRSGAVCTMDASG